MSLSQSHDVNSLSWLIHTCDYFLSVTAFLLHEMGCMDVNDTVQTVTAISLNLIQNRSRTQEKNAPCELAFKIKISNNRLSRITGSKNHDVDFPMSVSTEPITLNEDTPNEVQVRVITDVRGKIITILIEGLKIFISAMFRLL